MDDLSLFHVSAHSYECGEKIGPFTGNDFVLRVSASDEHVRRMEALLDKRKPPDVVSRKNAIFGFDTVGYCAAWWGAERRSGRLPELYSQPPNYYEVRLIGLHRAPYYLTSYTARCMAHGVPAEAIADEYWRPMLPWRLWEFLGTSAGVVRRVLDGVEDRRGMTSSLEQDMRLAMNRWPYHK
jgi:hypothetical protein